jgi:alanyl-tRNA synthetase
MMLKSTDMDANQIRNEYLKFFEERGHKIIPRAKLIPENDPTTLFTGSGMQPLLPYLLGESHPEGVCLANSQPCFRAQDIDDIGDNRHTTFFEMLGNWSLGNYFKEQQIRWFFEFLTEKVGLDPSRLYVSAFIGDEVHGIPRDNEAADIWKKVFEEKGIEAKIVEIGSKENGDQRGVNPGERIFFYDDKENWWSRGGGIGTTPIGDPCGPDSEVFYDFGPQNHIESFGLAHPAGDSGRFVEIGNQVFMQYRRAEDGNFEPLEKKNVDFGGGLERISAAAIDSPDVYKISLMWPIVKKIEDLSKKKYDFTPGDLGYDTMPECWLEVMKSIRVIADHLRAATFLAVDGVTPSNKEQGYVMRRFLRRAIRFALELGIEQNFLQEIVPVIADLYHNDFPDVAAKREEVIAILVKEEKVFRQTLSKGLRELSKFASNGLTGTELFTLYDTYGFPIELSTEEANKQNIKLSESWRDEFDAKMAEQRERSRTATKGEFKGGLADDGEIATKYHTAAHLLMQALRDVLGNHVSQKGSNITADRLRLDFSHPEKMTSEQITEVERIVNEKIEADLPVVCEEMNTEQAKASGAQGVFSDKYGDKVKVYSIGRENEKPFSMEICGGPHIKHTGQLTEGGRRFKITKEESSSAGVRRIKAIFE